MSDRQRAMFTDKLPDTANVVMAGTVFGQAIGGEAFSRALAAAGIALWAGLIASSLWLTGRSVK